MQVAEIQVLFDYYYWATAQILRAAETISNEQFSHVRPYCQRSLRAILVHTLSAERLWRTRWQGAEPVTHLEEQAFPTLAVLHNYWQQQEQEMRASLASMQQADLTRLLTGTLGNGTAYADPIWHSMMHVLFHGAQHRSEAAEILTEHGFSPGELDFFVFLRQKGQ
jgi:uncharacterized damage-inducible protein DinB